MPRPVREDLQERAVHVLERRPRDEIVGCRDENVGDVEVHPVRPTHFGRDDATPLDAGEDRTGLRFQIQVLAAIRLGEGGTLLGPVDEVPGGRDGESGDAAVSPRGRGGGGNGPRPDDTGGLPPPRPLLPPPRGPGGGEDRRGAAGGGGGGPG